MKSHFKVVQIEELNFGIGAMLTPEFAEGLGDDLMDSSNSAFRALGSALKRGAIELQLREQKIPALEKHSNFKVKNV